MEHEAAQHDFVIVVPVADRPQHLSDCLRSLLELRRRFPYAGRVSVLIADDSRDQENIAQHRSLAEAIAGEGVPTHHLGQADQHALIQDLSPLLRARLAGVIGNNNPEAFHHKGASITRNIAYLWLNRLQKDGKKRLFWFIDSDQKFRANMQTASGDEQPYAIDYFHWLDRIFSETTTRILTGKVVGDPPVSPAVMAATFLDDVLAYLTQMAKSASHAACSFHGQPIQKADDAAYHDMAELFGFKPGADTYRYRCPLLGAHDHAACFTEFAERLGQFFDGAHPTRRSFYQPDNPVDSIKPARTIYTGNYVFTAAGLDWFIPFAALKLRMAGPTLGRMIKAELGDAFVSANLPMLHKRTLDEIGQSECRPGIKREDSRVDLSGEFERQYFGDILLFAMERLTVQGYPAAPVADTAITGCIDAAEIEIHARYLDTHGEIGEKIARLRALFDDRDGWWRQDVRLAGACRDVTRFIDNLYANFADDSPAWQLVNSAEHRLARKAAIGAAICRYRDDRDAWQAAMRHAQP